MALLKLCCHILLQFKIDVFLILLAQPCDLDPWWVPHMCQRRNPQDLDGGEQWQENKTGEKANALQVKV